MQCTCTVLLQHIAHRGSTGLQEGKKNVETSGKMKKDRGEVDRYMNMEGKRYGKSKVKSKKMPSNIEHKLGYIFKYHYVQ